jgi:Domain of unknown function (DUF4440)
MMRIALAIAMCISCASLAQQHPNLSTILRQKDQALADAIAPGDRKVWEAVLSSDFFYADENNDILSKDDFLKEFVPLPKGISGKIVVRQHQVRQAGDTAIVVHRDEETERYFGSELHAQYLMTEVWQELNGEWKLRSVHCAAVPIDPPAITLTTTEMDELVGTFQAGALTYAIRREGNRILAGQLSSKEVELKAETRDVLFVSGQPRSRKVFLRNAQGVVTGFADRRENRDLTWIKSDKRAK